MITEGTRDDFKKSILGNLTFRPDAKLLRRVQECFVDEDFDVVSTGVKEYTHKPKGGYVDCLPFSSIGGALTWQVVRITFKSSRATEDGVLVKTLRATRRARLNLYQFSRHCVAVENGIFAINLYVAELREHA
jgi:hypothetical protein